MNDFSVFDLFLDLPHPASSWGDEKVKVIAPAVCIDASCETMANELHETQNIARITRFAFPEHDDQIHACNMTYREAVHEAMKDAENKKKKKGSGAGLNKRDLYLFGFQSSYHTFGLQLVKGMRVYGHVRRYLPSHRDALSRIDVGMRGPRAMVIFTRAPGGHRFYLSVLKTLEAIQTFTTGTHSSIQDHVNHQQAFLHSLQERQYSIMTDYKFLECMKRADGSLMPGSDALMSDRTNFDEESNYTEVVTRGMEYAGSKLVNSLDVIRYRVPQALQPGFCDRFSADEINSPILPLLRCLGASHSIRLLCALMSERRILLISKNSSLLSACVTATAAMLAQGLLIWQHVYVPVLPPHLFKYLASETPYLIGVLECHSANLGMVPGILDLLTINIDDNTLQTYRMPNPSISVPDLLLPVKQRKREASTSCSELLAQDLSEIIKGDERYCSEGKGVKVDSPDAELVEKDRRSRLGRGGSSFFNKKGVRQRNSFSSMNILEDPSVVLGKMMRTINSKDKDKDKDKEKSPPNPLDRNAAEPPQSPIGVSQDKMVAENNTEIATECCENETAEEGARIAFVTFFLYLYGDMGIYLSERNGKFALDRKKFIGVKRLSGLSESNPLFLLLSHFSRTAMFRRFVKFRIQEIDLLPEEKRKCMPHHKSLFSLCEMQIRTRQIEWTLANIRNVIQKTSLNTPQRVMAVWSDELRKKALFLTSTRDFSGNALKALAELIDQCREVNGSLCHIMSVVWTRLQDGRASMWKHPLLGLYVLRNILMHGPLTTVTEAMDGIDKIRALKSYNQSKNAREVRDAANEIYELLVDRPRLFSERRQLSCRRLKLDTPKKTPRWEDYIVRRLPVLVEFNQIHKLIRPKHVASVRDDIREQVSRRDSMSSSTNSSGMGMGRGTPPRFLNACQEQAPDSNIHSLVNLFNSSLAGSDEVSVFDRGSVNDLGRE